jgi:hypothetical protein
LPKVEPERHENTVGRDDPNSQLRNWGSLPHEQCPYLSSFYIGSSDFSIWGLKNGHQSHRNPVPLQHNRNKKPQLGVEETEDDKDNEDDTVDARARDAEDNQGDTEQVVVIDKTE